jgi:hypothetical protein
MMLTFRIEVHGGRARALERRGQIAVALAPLGIRVARLVGAEGELVILDEDWVPSPDDPPTEPERM